MNEQWVIDKIHEASTGGNLVKKDPESADFTFCIGVSQGGEAPRWGNISGDINDQDDLTAALNGKVSKSAGSPALQFGADDNGVFVDIGDAAL